MIPSENELARMYGISRVTARAVVTELVNDGFLYRVQGKGTFVAPNRKMEMMGPAWGGVNHQLEGMGKNTRIRLVDFRIMLPSVSIARKLNISQETPVRYICRVRYANDEPVSIHRAYLPSELCPTLTPEALEREPVRDILQREYNLRPVYIKETLEVSHATDFEADLLGMPPGNVTLLLEGIGYSKMNEAYQVASIVFNGEKIKLHFNYGPDQMLD